MQVRSRRYRLNTKDSCILSLPSTNFKLSSRVCTVNLSFSKCDNHLAGIRAEDVVAGFKRMPVGFYVLVEFDSTKRRTENKPVRLHDSNVDWDDRIRLWDTLFSLICRPHDFQAIRDLCQG